MSGGIRREHIAYTKAKIYDAFLDLLSEKALDKITVKDICTYAGISRSTFYQHYEDINQLTDALRNWYIVPALPYYQRAFDSSGVTLDMNKLLIGVRGHLEILASWPKYAVTLLGNQDILGIFKQMEIICEQTNTERNQSIPGHNNRNYEYYYAYISGGVCNIILKWCRDGMVDSTEQIVSYITEFIKNSNKFL